MSYLGGKARYADFILAVLNDPHIDGRDYVEPMLGMAHSPTRLETPTTKRDGGESSSWKRGSQPSGCKKAASIPVWIVVHKFARQKETFATKVELERSL